MTSVLRRKRQTTVLPRPTRARTAVSLAAFVLLLAVPAVPAQQLPPKKGDDQVLPPPTMVQQDKPRPTDQPRPGMPPADKLDGEKQYQIQLSLPPMEEVYRFDSEKQFQARIRRETQARAPGEEVK